MAFEIKRQMLLKRIRRRCESILFLCIHILVLTMYTDVWLNSTYSSGLGWGEETLTLQQNYLSEHNYVLSMNILRETMVIPPNRVLHMTWAKQPYFWKYMSSQGGYFEGDKIILVLSVCKTCRSRSQTHPVVYQTKGKRERERDLKSKQKCWWIGNWKLGEVAFFSPVLEHYTHLVFNPLHWPLPLKLSLRWWLLAPPFLSGVSTWALLYTQSFLTWYHLIRVFKFYLYVDSYKNYSSTLITPLTSRLWCPATYLTSSHE